MADYDEDGNIIPPSDAESARENIDAPNTSPGVWDSGVGDAIVTVNANKESSVLGMFLMFAALYFIFSGREDS